MSPTPGVAGDASERKDNFGNVETYISPTGELVAQEGLAIGGPGGRFAIGTAATATMPATASVAYTSGTVATGGVTITIPSAAKVTAGRLLIIKDENGSATSSNVIKAVTGAGGGTIDGTAQGTAVTVVNAAKGVARLYSDGTNWWLA